MGDCNPMQLANGTACNNHNACMSNDQCSGGMCLGTPITGCKSYYVESFETCPAGWTLTGDWQCGIPTAVGPPAAEQGQRCVGTKIAGDYTIGDTYAATEATSPSISLAGAVNPKLAFYLWVQTEEFEDGGVLQISSDNGTTWAALTTTKAYNDSINGKNAWDGDQSNSRAGRAGARPAARRSRPHVARGPDHQAPLPVLL